MGGEELLKTVGVQNKLQQLESALLTQARKLNRVRDESVQKQIATVKAQQEELKLLESGGTIRGVDQRQILFTRELQKAGRALSSLTKDDLPNFNRVMVLNVKTLDEAKRSNSEPKRQ